MLKLLDHLRIPAVGSRDGHPLDHPKEAEQIFGELRAADSAKALDETAQWLESVAGADNLKPERRFALIKQLDEIAQPHRIRLSRSYAALPREAKSQEEKLWTANHDFWARCSDAWDNLIDRIEEKEKGCEALVKNQAGMIAVRALRAAGMRLKWIYAHYGPVPSLLWERLARAYEFAEMRRLQLTHLIVYPGVAGDASPEGEFTRALVLAASAPDALSPAELDIVERLAASCAGKFRVSMQPQPDSTYWFDLVEPRPPLRLVVPPTMGARGLRYFATAAGHSDMQALLKKADQGGELPREIDLGGVTDMRVVRDVLKHLVLNWAPRPPVRKAERRRIKARVKVAHGFPCLVELMQRGGDEVDIPLGMPEPETETWMVENISVGGLAATVPQVNGDWLKIGSLLAVQPDVPGGASDQWDLAIVRRLAREGDAKGAAKNQASAGIQVLARKAITVDLRPRDSAWSGGIASVEGIYMHDAAEPGAALLAIPPDLYMPGEQLQTHVAGKRHLLFPIGVAERSHDYDMIRFRDMVEDN
jgi:hypothetical protein